MNTLLQEVRPEDYEPCDDAVRVAIYNSENYSSAQLQICIHAEILKSLGLTGPNCKVEVKSGHGASDYTEWLEVWPGGDFGTLSQNKTASLEWSVRGSTAKAGVWDQSCKQKPCYAELFTDHLKIQLPRSIRLANQTEGIVNDDVFIKHLASMMRDAKTRGYTIRQENGRLLATRQESVALS